MPLAAQRKKLAAGERDPALIVGLILKCSVCVLLLALLLVIGAQTEQTPVNLAQLINTTIGPGTPNSANGK